MAAVIKQNGVRGEFKGSTTASNSSPTASNSSPTAANSWPTASNSWPTASNGPYDIGHVFRHCPNAFETVSWS